MPPVPISASKAAILWLRSVEAGRAPSETNRTARIAYAAATNCFWGGIASSLPAVPCQVQHSSAGLVVVIVQSMAFGKFMGKWSCEVCGAKFHHCQSCPSCPSCPRFVQEPSNLVLKILNLPNPFLRLQGILKAYTFWRACEGCFLHPVSKARGSFFSDTHAASPQYVPRAVFVDTDPSTRNEMLTGSNRDLFHPESILGYKQDCKNIFFEGRHMASDAGFKIKEDVMDRIRLTVDLCGNLQGFFVFHSFGGGTGSGLGTEVLHALHDAFDKKTIFQPVIYPSNQFSSSIVEPYNCIFSTYFMRDVVDVSLMLDNQAAYKVCENKLNIKQPTFDHVNRLIAQCISSCTTSLRFETQLSSTLVEIVTNIVPTQHYRYPIVSLAPVRARDKQNHETFVEEEIVTELFESKNVLCDVTHLKQNRYLSAVVLLRGIASQHKDRKKGQDEAMDKSVEANHVIHALHNLKDGTHRSPLKFVPWITSGFKVGLVGVPPCVVDDDTCMAKTERNGAMLGNSTAVRQLFVRQYCKFLKLFYRRAYVWQFLESTGEIEAFYDAREGVQEIIGHYEELLRECVRSENAKYDGNTILQLSGETALLEGTAAQGGS